MTYTDAELIAMEKQLNKIYTQANKDIQAKWDAYMKKADAKTNALHDKYENAMLFGTQDEMLKAKDAYEKACYNVTLKNQHYQDMVNQVTDKLSDTNQIALTYLNDQMPKVYCHSFNDFGEEHIKGYSFEMVDESTVKYLVQNGNKSLLPQKQLNIPKDKQWNTKNINSQVLQGILQGESIPNLSKRMMNVTDMNHKSAVKNARTMTTGAENKGRMDSYIKAQNDGVILKKVWVSHHSERTRDWHADLSGVEKDINEPFENDYGEIMYPGDPTAHPANVYNCRCSIKTKILGFKPMGQAWKQTQPQQPQQPTNVVGKYVSVYGNISATAQYYSMLDENSALGNEFWKTLKAEGKPSQVWKDYLSGNSSAALTDKLDDLLSKYKGTGQPVKPGTKSVLLDKYSKIKSPYAPDLTFDEFKLIDDEYFKMYGANSNVTIDDFWKKYKTGKIQSDTLDNVFKLGNPIVKPKPKPDMGMYQGKSMTATYYSVQAEDKALGKQFWDLLQAEDNPSVMWSEYLAGIAPQEFTDKLDAILLQHKGVGAWTKPVSTKNMVLKAEYANIDTLADLHDADYSLYMKVKQDFMNDMNFTGTPNDYWVGLKNGTIKNTEIEKLIKEKKPKTAAKKTATATVNSQTAAVVNTADDLDDLEKAKEQFAIAKGNLDSLGSKTYSGIWKQDVSLSDYEAKAPAIQAKKDYYLAEMDKLANDPTYATQYSAAEKTQQIAKYQKYLDDLDEFEMNGKLYVQYSKAYKDAAEEVKRLTPVGERFGPEAYTQARRDMAAWAKTGTDYHTLDQYYDDVAKKVHATRTSIEKEAYDHYTWGSMPFNSPLAGYEGDRYTRFIGVGKVDINVGGYGEKIRGLTSLIEKSTYDQDIWIQSAQGEITIETFLGIKPGTLSHMSVADAQAFVGVENKIPQFISGAVQKGGGTYNPGNMTVNIYCPSGSEMLYVRQDGHFGKAEKEMILQRGGTYKLTKIYRGRGTHGYDEWIVDLELHPENGYDKFQQIK